MSLDLHIPSPAEFTVTAGTLGSWQQDPWPGCLHPGDLGWHSLVGQARTAADLRVWSRDGVAVAIGMFDGEDAFRLAVSPGATDDHEVARGIRDDLGAPNGRVRLAADVLLEARGARALRTELARDWLEDEHWIPLTMSLAEPIDTSPVELAGLRIDEVGVESAGAWIEVHWQAFKSIPLDDATRSRFVDRWIAMATGPFAHLATQLLAYDQHDVPVAVSTVWTAGAGRPGLIEPMGVHPAHRGKGYGSAITVAGAAALQRADASVAAVVAEGSNSGALATYSGAGFEQHPSVADLRRS